MPIYYNINNKYSYLLKIVNILLCIGSIIDVIL